MIQAKRRNDNGIVRHTDRGENFVDYSRLCTTWIHQFSKSAWPFFFLAELCIKFQEESLVQELAELLVIALAGYRPRNSTKGDQEAFVVTITGRSYVSWRPHLQRPISVLFSRTPCQQHSGRVSAGQSLPEGSKRGTKNAVRTGKVHLRRPDRAGTAEACVKRACGGLSLTLYILYSPDRKTATRSLLPYQFAEYYRRVVRGTKYPFTLGLSYLNNRNAFCYSEDERTNQSKPKTHERYWLN